MTGSSHKRDPHGGADPYSKLSHAQDRRRRTLPMVIGGTVVVVAICALIAILATRSDDTDSGAAAGTGAAAAADAKQETAEITVTGEPLPSMPEMAPGSYFTDVSTDKAIGMPSTGGNSQYSLPPKRPMKYEAITAMPVPMNTAKCNQASRVECRGAPTIRGR